MKQRALAPGEHVEVILSDESSSSDTERGGGGGRNGLKLSVSTPTKQIMGDDMLMRRAEMYQEYMKQIPIPLQRGSVIPFSSWMGLGKSIKQLYGQPLHYLTNVLLKQWDESRNGSEDEYRPLDIMLHPCKAEATIWLVEEIHRCTSSHLYVAKLWLSDPMHHVFIDPIFPEQTHL